MNKKLLVRILLALIIVGSYALIYRLPMWSFKFVAPQYPQGLELQVFLTGAQGDVFEIDIINHYIGMSKLEDAAINEKAFAPYSLIALSILAVMIAFCRHSKKVMRIASLPILLFPMGFVVTFYYWLYKFGHDLNPAAPVDITPFTPTILGTGIIGQFKTFAVPGSGFYLACFAAGLTLLILRLHEEKSGCGCSTSQTSETPCPTESRK